MDHWVSVLSFPTLAGPGKDCLILIRDCGFFLGSGSWTFCPCLPLQVGMGGAGTWRRNG